MSSTAMGTLGTLGKPGRTSYRCSDSGCWSSGFRGRYDSHSHCMTAIGSVIGRPGQLAHPSCFRVTVLRCTPPPAFQKGIQQRTRDVSRCARQGKKHLHRHKPPTGDPDSSSPDGDSGQEAPSTSQPKYISSDPPGHRAGNALPTSESCVTKHSLATCPQPYACLMQAMWPSSASPTRARARCSTPSWARSCRS